MIKEFPVEFAGQKYPSFYVDSKDKAEAVIRQLASKKTILAADLETMPLPEYMSVSEAALSPFLGKPRLIQMFTGTGAVVIDLMKTGPIDLKTIFHSRPSVFHNMTFDHKMLHQHYGVRQPDMHCTCLMARCVFHAMYPDVKSASLAAVSKALFGQEVSKKAGGSDWSMPDLTFEQVLYAAKDAVIQMKMYEKLNDYLDKLKLRPVYEIYRKAQLVINQMELNGIGFDVEAHKKNIVKWRQDLVDARDEIQRITDITIITDTKVGDWLKKTLPPEVLAVWPRTSEKIDPATGEDIGRLSTDANTLVDFGHLEIVKPFSTYQKAKKLTTSFGMNMLTNLNPKTGKIHCSYTVVGAKTGRLSCSNPNIQQAPRSKAFRATFIPSKGYEMVVADYSQVEVRCIAELANDKKMLAAYEQGLDIYKYTASHLTGRKYAEIGDDDPDRQNAKALVLGLNYGLGAKKFAHYAKKNYGVNISKEDAFDQVEAYRKLYPELREWQLEQVRICPIRRYTAFSVSGKSRKMTDEDFFGACMNHPVQGSCAEIMLLALIYAAEALKDTSFRFLACVHDEILGECLPEDTVRVKELLTKAMLKAYTTILPSGRTIKKLVEPTSGKNWAAAKEKPKKPAPEMKVIKESAVNLIEDSFL